MPKDNALQKIESHEKLCRIMQKQTHDRINQLENQINRVESILLVSVGTLIAELQTQITRIERILLVSMGSVMTGMAGVIIVLIYKNFKSNLLILHP
jgi:predicted PurR-regulated permease PerM